MNGWKLLRTAFELSHVRRSYSQDASGAWADGEKGSTSSRNAAREHKTGTIVDDDLRGHECVW
jgi:hypothetical protein